MSKPLETWNEDDVLALPLGENDTFERKGSKLLDLTLPGVRESNVLNELAKQLSAFSNIGGGRIFYRVADDGTVDNGGVALSVKGSTKEWVGDIVPTLTEFQIVGFNVYEMRSNPTNSKIATGQFSPLPVRGRFISAQQYGYCINSSGAGDGFWGSAHSNSSPTIARMALFVFRKPPIEPHPPLISN